MIARPRQLADVDHALPVGTVPDLDALTANVVRAGGRADVFVRSYSAGMRAAGERGVASLDLLAVSAWRAGALALRDDALARLRAAQAADAPWTWAGAALGLAPDALGGFVVRQAGDRWWWPGRAVARGYVSAVGGFSGLGGGWISPPDAWRPLGIGAFAVRVAGEWWRLDADVWGSRLRRLDAEPAVGGPDPTATLVIGPTTHLAWVRATAG